MGIMTDERRHQILLDNGWESYTPTTYVKKEWLEEEAEGPNWYRHETLKVAYDIHCHGDYKRP